MIRTPHGAQLASPLNRVARRLHGLTGRAVRRERRQRPQGWRPLEQIAPLAKAAGEVRNARWGQLMRAGNDKSHLARQIERRADIYTSRVSNFLFLTPFVFLRSMRGSLPHDPAAAAAVAAENLAAPAPGEAEG
ncbi:MAG TPA: 5'-nucleotidase domain-containing protein [Microvirga sp.]|nr:5'-nucleotidase domain-containing protein [Microvirga sp.]